MVLNKAINYVLTESNFRMYNHSEHGNIIGTIIAPIIVSCSQPTIILNI